MLISDKDISIDNSGSNTGVIVGTNNGNINYLLKDTIKIPSLISSLVKTLSSACVAVEYDESPLDLSAFRPDEKIQYNSIIKYNDIIKEHATYYTYCERALNIFDDSNMGVKAKILHCVRCWYLESKGQLLLELKESKEMDIEKIRNNADLLIDNVIKKITSTIYSSANFFDSSSEEISLGVICFVCYCFMECKIMEKPK